MKNSNLTKLFAIGIFVPLLGTSLIYANTKVISTIEANSSNITCMFENSCSFAELKKETLTNLKEELSYTTNKKIKSQIEKSLKILNTINNENKFYNTLEKEYKTIDRLYEEDIKFKGNDYDDADISKKDIIKGLKEELKVIKDKKIRSEVNAKILLLSKMENKEKMFELLEETYATLDQYYEENNINIFDKTEKEALNIDVKKEYQKDFATEKKEIIEMLKKEQIAQNKIDNIAKINDEEKFWEEVEKVEVERFGTDENRFWDILDKDTK